MSTDPLRMASLYAAATLAWTWAVWAVPWAAGDPWAWPQVMFLYAGGLGPCLIAVILTARDTGRAGLAGLARRLWDPRRIGWRYGVLALALMPLVTAASALATGSPLRLDPSPLAAPVTFVSTSAFLFVLGPLPEELGWRGVMLERLLRRWRFGAAVLAVGGIWALWHAPLFWMDGYYDRFDFDPDPVRFTAQILIASAWIGWIYVRTHGSVLAAVLAHFSINWTGEILDVDRPAETLAMAVVAAGLLVLAGLSAGPGKSGQTAAAPKDP